MFLKLKLHFRIHLFNSLSKYFFGRKNSISNINTLSNRLREPLNKVPILDIERIDNNDSLNQLKFTKSILKKSSKTNLFTKFSNTDIKDNELEKKNKFKKVLREDIEFEKMTKTLDDKKLVKRIDEQIAKGIGMDEILKEVAGTEEPPEFYDQHGSESIDNENNQFIEAEINLIKQSLENKRSRTEDNSGFNIPEYEQKGFLYTDEELKKLKEEINKKKKRIETKNTEKIIKYSVKKEIENEENEEIVDKFYENNKKKAKNQFEEEFRGLFNSAEVKNKKKNKKDSHSELDFDNIRDLRKIKNSTNPEYLKSSMENSTSSKEIESKSDADIVDSIPDINIIEKRSKNVEKELYLKNLIYKDLHPVYTNLEKKEDVIEDARKLSKINTLNIVDLRKNKNEIFKKRALQLAKIWRMYPRETKQWFYRIRREEKLIIKALLMKKKLEQKRKLKKLAKQWTLENEENIDLNYFQLMKEDELDINKNEDIDHGKMKIPPSYKNIDEFLFFGDEIEFMKHYKRTCRNILNSLNLFFSKNKQIVSRKIGNNADVVISEVKMNKGCTVIYAWWDLPIVSGIVEISQEDLNTLYKTVQVNLSKATPFIKGYITREIGLKYAPEIRFIKDTFDEEFENFSNSVRQFKMDEIKFKSESKRKKEEQILRILDIPQNTNIVKSYISQIKNNEERTKLNEILFAKNNLPLSKNLMIFSQLNPKVYNTIINQVKTSLGVTNDEVKEIEKNFPKTKQERKNEKKKEKMFKKYRITNEDLKGGQNVDLEQSLQNYLYNYERKIPGQYTLHPSGKDIQEKINKAEFMDGVYKKRVKDEIDKEVKRVHRPIKKTKRDKSVEFWKNIDNKN